MITMCCEVSYLYIGLLTQLSYLTYVRFLNNNYNSCIKCNSNLVSSTTGKREENLQTHRIDNNVLHYLAKIKCTQLNSFRC